MKVNIRMFVGGVEWNDLDKETQEKCSQKITDIYSEIVSKRVVEMINKGRWAKEIKEYLLLE